MPHNEGEKRMPITLKITALAHGGEGIGRHEGRAIFVPYTIPGETVRVEIGEEARRFARARLIEVIEPSPARILPHCPHFGPGRCGGCHFQQIAYPTQARLKSLVVVDQLRRIGKLDAPPVLEPIPDATGWAYRNHARFHIDPEGRPGFVATDGHTVIPIQNCPILHPNLNDLLERLEMRLPYAEWMELRTGTATGDLMLVLQTVDEEPPALTLDLPLSVVQVRHDGALAPLIGLDYIEEKFNGRTFRISATSFYQVNTPQAERLITLVLEALALQEGEAVLDAYAGIGMFTAFLAERNAYITAIESHHIAVADARHNLADFERVRVLEGNVETILPSLEARFDAVLVDPPRAGLDRRVLDAIVAAQPGRIAYVSCDPATLARDTRRLLDQGYALRWVQPIDLFPQTYHIENVALFTPAGEADR